MEINTIPNILTNNERLEHLKQLIEILAICQQHSKETSAELTSSEAESHQSLLKLKKKIQSNCYLCSSSSSLFYCECGLKYCYKCLKPLLMNSKPCQDCESPFSTRTKSEFSLFLSRDKTPFTVLCENCKFGKISKFCKDSCNHLCMSCVQKSLESLETYCPVCFMDLAKVPDYHKIFDICQGCGNIKYFIRDSIKKLSCGHSLCISCIRFSMKTRQCKLCASNLNEIEVLRLLNEITDHCLICKQNYYLPGMTFDREKGICCDNCSDLD